MKKHAASSLLAWMKGKIISSDDAEVRSTARAMGVPISRDAAHPDACVVSFGPRSGASAASAVFLPYDTKQGTSQLVATGTQTLAIYERGPPTTPNVPAGFWRLTGVDLGHDLVWTYNGTRFYRNGVGPDQAAAVRGDFQNMLEALSVHFAENDFLLGDV